MIEIFSLSDLLLPVGVVLTLLFQVTFVIEMTQSVGKVRQEKI